MYLQITTRCNMKCAHCCYNCTMDGEDMSLDTFRAALDHMGAEYITIGGGEPTLHPFFEQILLECISVCEERGVLVITNGSHIRRSMMLAELADKRVMSAELSQDEFHDPIDPTVVDRFEKLGPRYVRNTTRHKEPYPVGRALEYLGYDEDNELPEPRYPGADCICNTTFIQPDGKVKVCGCLDAPYVGDVFTDFAQYGDCWQSTDAIQELAEAGLI